MAMEEIAVSLSFTMVMSMISAYGIMIITGALLHQIMILMDLKVFVQKKVCRILNVFVHVYDGFR